VNPLPHEDPTKAYQLAERRLRELLFGDGTFTPGMVKGEERRLEVTTALRRMRQAFEHAAASGQERARAEVAEARVADLGEELRRRAADTTRERSDSDA